MSNGTPPVESAPVPPSIAGIPQPVFAGGSATVPATPIPITGSPIIPPPTIGDPEGFPVFPPTGTGTAPVPVPVGPLVGPAVPAAPVPPSVAGFPQPQYSTGSGTTPTAAALFPAFTAAGPNPPIIVVTSAPPPPIPLPLPTTPGTQPIIISAVPTIPQLPWNPNPPEPELPPVNTVLPIVQIVTTLTVGAQLALTTGTWTTTAAPLTYAREWLRDGSPIAGATGAGYVLTTADLGAHISGIVTATDANGVEASAESVSVGPVLPAAPIVTPGQSFSATLPLTASQALGTVAATGAPTAFAITSGNASGDFAISAGGVISVTAAGATGIVAGTIVLGVTAANAGGTSPAVNVSIVVAAASDPLALPVNRVLPRASLNDDNAFCNTGEWDSGVDSGIMVSLQWFADGEPIGGATNGTWYFLGYQGQEAYCAVTATNVNGSVTVDSNTFTVPGGEEAEAQARSAPRSHHAKPRKKR